MIQFDHVSKHYGKTTILSDLSFTIPDGQFLVLIGPSGCGKTTTMKMINRLLEPDGGRVLIDGKDAASMDKVELRRHIGYVIQQYAEDAGYSVVREFCGHGVGIEFHEEPQVLHYGRRNTMDELKPGMIFTIEPMINAGGKAIRSMPDGWTIRTKDRSLSAQWEHTILVTDTGYEVLTVSPDMPSPPHFIRKNH